VADYCERLRPKNKKNQSLQLKEKRGNMSDSEPKKMLDPDPRVWDFETEYELGQDNIRPLGLDIHNPVFIVSGILIMGFVIAALANQEAAA
jgi:BCCT family betaine/carnitine transporter